MLGRDFPLHNKQNYKTRRRRRTSRSLLEQPARRGTYLAEFLLGTDHQVDGINRRNLLFRHRADLSRVPGSTRDGPPLARLISRFQLA